MSDNSDSEDLPGLSSETFAALQEFYKEQEQRENKLNSILHSTQSQDVEGTNPFEENWQLSQFWYDVNTVNSLSKAITNCVGLNGKVALISCPSLFTKLKESGLNVTLFEYDERFSIFGNDFIFYDYKSPLSIPRELASTFDLVVADPPFLAEECLTKTAVTIKFLAKEKILLCTGSIMTELAAKLLDLKKCQFEPSHTNNLANEFWCFTNFNLDAFIRSK